MALGYQHSCALLSGGRARCWGYNRPGSLGDGTGVDQLNPVVVMASLGVPFTGAQALASGGYHSCALMNNGQVICWGATFLVNWGTAQKRIACFR
jgi:Regulator of chromosome condensation (RCC1) repeat